MLSVHNFNQHNWWQHQQAETYHVSIRSKETIHLQHKWALRYIHAHTNK